MIRLVKNPKPSFDTAEGIRIYENYRVYGDIALFWHQNGGKAVISMLDGNMIISGNCNDFYELSAFITAVSPKSIFTNAETLKGLNIYEHSLKVSVLLKENFNKQIRKSDVMSSDEIYGLLKKGGFELPDFRYFAPDFCLRLNRKRLCYFAIRDKAAALCIGKKNVLINGLVSMQKGYGSLCLNGLLSALNPERAFVCAKNDVEKFYIKNGFRTVYQAGYWRQ